MATNEVQSQASERHYTVKELAEKWALDESTIRKMFRDEPGVLVIGSNGIRAKRKQYVTLRIPESAMLRVYFSRANQSSVSRSRDRGLPGTRRHTERNATP